MAWQAGTKNYTSFNKNQLKHMGVSNYELSLLHNSSCFVLFPCSLSASVSFCAHSAVQLLNSHAGQFVLDSLYLTKKLTNAHNDDDDDIFVYKLYTGT